MRGFISFAAPASPHFSSFSARETEETFFIARTYYFFAPLSSTT
jgi:hypothetical protein